MIKKNKKSLDNSYYICYNKDVNKTKQNIKRKKEDFDIDFRMFKKKLGDGEQHILIEKRYAYIGGGASGNTETVNQFKKVYRAVHRYYGVTKEDIKNKTRRYEDYLKQLAR